MTPTVCLTLLLPRDLQDDVIDLLLQHPEWIGPFTAAPVAGHGSPHRIASAAEEVRGHAARIRIDLPLAAEAAGRLLALLRAELGGSEIDWWLTPLLDAGSLSP